MEQKVALYADDVLVYVSNTRVNIPRLISITNSFGTFTGYKVNAAKSELMWIRKNQISISETPFKEVTSHFRYLGINVSANPRNWYDLNISPILLKVKEYMKNWQNFPLSFTGRIALFKMVLLPKILFPLQNVPVLLKTKDWKSLCRALRYFIWKCKRPRISINRLFLPKRFGGMALPDLSSYTMVFLARIVIDWILNKDYFTNNTLEINVVYPYNPIALIHCPMHLMPKEVKHLSSVYTVIQAWKKLGGKLSIDLSIPKFQGLCGNPEFQRGTQSQVFQKWHKAGLIYLTQFIDQETQLIKTFEGLRQEFKLSNKDFFAYLQARHYLSSLIDKYGWTWSWGKLDSWPILAKSNLFSISTWYELLVSQKGELNLQFISQKWNLMSQELESGADQVEKSIATVTQTTLSATLTSNAQSCAFCHATAGVCTQKTNYVSCSCSSGYIGNGINCTVMLSCGTESCCPQGYTWDNRVGYKQCVDVNECADSSLNKCVPSNTCTNKNGIHLCGSTRSIACSGTVCSNDQDCLKVNGAEQCADPCLYYQTLNGESRLSTLNSTGIFTTDRFNFGWFRYTGNSGLRIQEGCVGSLKCGSAEPFTLNGSHPAIGEGVTIVSLNSNGVSGCSLGASIPVKACAGGYFVYKFSGTLKTEVYCTDPAFNSNSSIPTKAPTTTLTTTTPATTTTTPTTTTPTTTTPTTTTPTTTTPTTTTPTTTIPTTTTPTTTILTTTTPTTTTPTTTTPTTTTPTTTPQTTTTSLTTTTTPIPTTSTEPELNITVITMRSSNVISVTSKTERDINMDVTSLEINETTSFYIEVKIITPSTIIIKTNTSMTPSHTLITVGDGDPETLADRSAPVVTSNETVVANMEKFQSQLYNSQAPQTKTVTETFTDQGKDFVITTTITTITNEEIIVINPEHLSTSIPASTK
ncbi:uncharacterized protein LOC128652419 [Bombina bombina]|uniref:uncharacterized protein LOC128652419 n=1 Tax=Bombina bombina TaxID=8345 RepID=UPI00235A9B55|nr:uncharacterized protein LOC128652419 [Bombina bombina]